MRGQTLPRQAQVVLTATMHAVGISCVDLGHVALQLHFTCSATLFLSFEVRACCDSAVDFTGKKVVFVVAIFKIEVARDFYVTKQRIIFPGVFFDFSELEESSLRRATVADGCLHRRAQSNFRFVPVPQTQCPSTSRRPSLKKSLSSPIMPCSRALFNVRNRASRCSTACRIVSRSMDPEVLTGTRGCCVPPKKNFWAVHNTPFRNVPAATRRSLQIAAHVDSFLSTPTCSHKQLARLTSLSFVRVGNESRF